MRRQNYQPRWYDPSDYPLRYNNRINKEDSIDVFNTKALAANIYRALNGICIIKEYIEQGVIIYYTNYY